MKIVTFNIRLDCGLDGKNNFVFRKDGILKKIAAERPDIIGFQEVLPHVKQWLFDNLTDYVVFGCGRGADFSDESMTFALRRDSVQLLGYEVFWLSETPYTPGSRYEVQSMCPRTCAMVIAQCKGFNTPIRVYSTHLDHEGAPARKLGLDQIFSRMADDKSKLDFPCILMGDFNAEPDSEELSEMTSDKRIPLTDAAETLGITYHAYGDDAESVKIDYLLIDGNFTKNNAVLWNECSSGVYLSDHYPICADISLK